MAYFSESIKDSRVKFLHNLYPSLQFVLLKFGIDIFDNFDTIGTLFCNVEFRLFHREDLV